MKQHVVLEVGLFAEATATHVALVRPRTTVHVQVALEVARSRKRLGAQRAFVRLLLYHSTPQTRNSHFDMQTHAGSTLHTNTHTHPTADR